MDFHFFLAVTQRRTLHICRVFRWEPSQRGKIKMVASALKYESNWTEKYTFANHLSTPFIWESLRNFIFSRPNDDSWKLERTALNNSEKRLWYTLLEKNSELLFPLGELSDTWYLIVDKFGTKIRLKISDSSLKHGESKVTLTKREMGWKSTFENDSFTATSRFYRYTVEKMTQILSSRYV